MIRYCYDADNIDNVKILETEDVIAAMKLSAAMYNKNPGFSCDQMHMIDVPKHKIIGNIHHDTTKPVVNTCEQYIQTTEEIEKHLDSMPYMLSHSTWSKQPSSDYDMLAESFNFAQNDADFPLTTEITSKLVSAALDVLLPENENSTKRLFIVMNEHTENFDLKTRIILSKITTFLPLEARRKLSFVSYCNDVTTVLLGYKIVICRPADAVLFKQNSVFDDSYFCFLEQSVIFPDIKPGSFAKYLSSHVENAPSLLSFFDQKLPLELKATGVIYDVLCNVLFLKVEPTPQKYLMCRKDVIKYIKQLYEADFIDNELITFIFETEAQIATKVSSHEALTVVTAMDFFFENKIIEKQLFVNYICDVRDLIDEELLFSMLGKYNLENEYNQILLSQSIFPDTLAAVIVEQIKDTTDLEKLLDEKTTLYGDIIFSNKKIKETIYQYLSTAVDFCDEKDSFTMVLDVSKTLKKYNVPDLGKIVTDVTGKISGKLKDLEAEKALKEQQEKLAIIKAQVLDSFTKVFESDDIKQLLSIPILKDCPKINLLKSEINEIAIRIIKANPTNTALLFPCLEYDQEGIACELNLFALNDILTEDKDNNEAVYSLLLELILNSKFRNLDFIDNGILLYLSESDAIYKKAKKNGDAIWKFAVDHVVTVKSNNKMLYLGIVGATGVLLIIGAAIVSSFFK